MSEIKHIGDKGDINVAVDDDGQTLWVCTRCGKAWIGRLTPAEEADDRTRRGLAISWAESWGPAAGIDVDEVVRGLEQGRLGVD
jgi:hypothetical protein